MAVTKPVLLKFLDLSRGTLRKKLKKYGLLSPSKTVAEEIQTESMTYYVARGMRRYYSSLGDTKPIEVYEMWLEQTEAPLLKETMQYCNNNQTRAAKILDLSRGTLRKKLKKYDLL